MRIVLSNVPQAEADRLARTLVEEHLAACVNLVPVRSVYRWGGAIQDDAEVTLVLKTSAERVAALTARLSELHSYDLPEIVVLPVDVDASSAAYVGWVRSSCLADE